jgi:hypothetical protein
VNYFRKPTNNADWEPELAIPATVTIAGDEITIANIRNHPRLRNPQLQTFTS